MQACFIEVEGRRLFAVRHRPGDAPARRVLVLPPFAEEMNKCRRLAAQAARALAASGCEVLLPDLYGTGDSAGDFGDADLALWRADAAALQAHLAAAAPGARPAVLAMRSGALLLGTGAAETAGADVLCWQPVLDGLRWLQQFVRLRVMASKFAGREETQKDLFGMLHAGQALEVAGYTVSPALAAGLEQAKLDATDFAGARTVTLLEFKPAAGGQVSVPLRKLAESVNGAECRLVQAEQFWMTQEIAAPPEVVRETVAVLGGQAVDV